METRDRPSPTAGWFIVLSLLLTVPVTAQDFTVRPSILVPVADSAQWFEPGFTLGAEWANASGGPWRFGLGVDVTQVPIKVRGNLLSLTIFPTFAFAFITGPTLAWILDFDVGWSMVGRADFSRVTGLPWGAAGASVRWTLEPTLAFRSGLLYQTTLGLYQGVTAWVGFELAGG